MNRLMNIKNKIAASDDALRTINGWKLKGNQIVFTNGCFDILHKGHVTYLALAASEGNKLVIALNSDESVKRQNKGKDRPINDQESRGLVIAALSFVDLVIYFDDDTPLELIKLLEPDVLVKGGDYNAEQKDPAAKDYIVGSDIVRKTGGTVKTIPFVEGFSTTSILNQLNQNDPKV